MPLNQFNLSCLDWTLTGFTPYAWQMGSCKEVGVNINPCIDPIPANIPTSVQYALRKAAVIPDWNIGLNAKEIEWIENRHWLFETRLPDPWFAKGKRYRLICRGLDHKGRIDINGKNAYDFNNCHIPHKVEITPFLRENDNILQIIFECPPRWLGQIYRSSEIRDWKPRFYYTWDWTSRVVQIGIWDEIYIEEISDYSFKNISIQTDFDPETNLGRLFLKGACPESTDLKVEINLHSHGDEITCRKLSASEFGMNGIHFEELDIEPWWPNDMGLQSLYDLDITLRLPDGQLCDQCHSRIGFKRVEWHPCEGSDSDADPWLCCINGKMIFLQGINWTPIRPNFADVTPDEYQKRLELYQGMGLNVLRVWGGATLEKPCFYELCDQLGLLVWQEFPLSSSGLDNYPPDDNEMKDRYLEVVKSYVARKHHHASMLLWSGGNELTSKEGRPLNNDHPLLKAAAMYIQNNDPQHRFIPTSPSGPCFLALEENYGSGRHWDVHGPWKVQGDLDQNWRAYWCSDDSLFRSEVGAPGPSSADMIRKYAGEIETLPDAKNPLWRRTDWWLEIEQFQKEKGHLPHSLEDYVIWGQKRQTTILTTAAEESKKRFPACGGIIIWMGHDSFPCTANTSILDFEGNPKMCSKALEKIFKGY